MGQRPVVATATQQEAHPPDMETLYRTHMRSLYAFIYSKVGNREAAEDLTAEVFIKALTRLDVRREEQSIVAWLFRVARTTVTDYWRAGRGVPAIPFEDGYMAYRQPTDSAGAHQRQAGRQAQAVLDGLPERYRAVLTYRVLQGLSVTETAERMKTTPANVKVMQHRALKRAATESQTVVHASPLRGTTVVA